MKTNGSLGLLGLLELGIFVFNVLCVLVLSLCTLEDPLNIVFLFEILFVLIHSVLESV